jgi:uncharacterized protein
MIDNVLGNKTNILVLRFLIRFDNQFFLANEISKVTDAGLRNIYDSLSTLTYENILTKKKTNGKTYYSFLVNSYLNECLKKFFEEEKKRFFLRNIKHYKIISDLESKIVKITNSNLVDIILYGSIAKGRDTINSDIDICLLLKEKDDIMKQKLLNLSLEKKFKQEIQIHIFTSKEFLESKNNPLIQNIIRDGISLKIGK